MHTIHTNPERLQRFLTEIAEYGATPNGGVTRLALSDEDRDARDRLKAWFEAAGCETHIDRMGNMFFVRPGKNRSLAPVMTGSHCDSQPQGGRFDGILGIIGGLEAVCALNDAGVTLERDLIVVNWTNEEGSRFTPGTTGSGVFAGKLDREAMYGLTDRNGLTFGGELERIGYKGAEDFDPRPLHANFEYHIEQGPVLERRGKTIGVPKGIVCLRWYDVEIQGVPNHAGPTPMNERQDAIYAFSRMASRIFDIGLNADGVVATVGEVHPSPNSRNVIAGHVHFTIDIRGWDETETDRVCADIETAIRQNAEATGCTVDIRRTWAVERAPFHPELVALIHESAEKLALPALDMVSGASHDTVYINQFAPSAMIFVPSIGGRSHAEVEETSWADCAAGADVLLNCIIKTGNDPEGVSYAMAD
ncbi:amidase, hydantoinase/carbamoylase family [Pseudodesulfovibrio mercurii]|uniref:Amidase, hydantoinase/carbamoylase family n=1 Tax=Pseudodesulfovibrio mercurii TaxID=641491 RepID=F0JCY5_9BACT|nr:Zn-dependent hydrolase [Pseudodesulfovibrio mercurii]EGB14477.1 amidase, hydantoinase/carbamoylase family [Pseudodesulfovibrio mercurii]